MKTKRGFWAAVLTAVFFCISGSVFAVLSGAGTQANPYLIQSRADFDEFAGKSSYWASGVHTKLMCDPNLVGTTYTQAVIAPDSSRSFLGVFDGNGHTISNLTINQPTKDYIGLFGTVGLGGQVKNLGVTKVNIAGQRYVGGLVGHNDYGSITTCYATGAVTGTTNVGGLVGSNWRNYSFNAGGDIISCYATGSVAGNSSVGGLVGCNTSYSSITTCYATGAVSGTGTSSQYIGGLVGYNTSHSLITSCYAMGSVTGTTDVGGLVGNNYLGYIVSCYATGAVSGSSYVGGLVGWYFGGLITSCYATGAVSGTSYVGGLVGARLDGALTACFWDIQTSGTSDGVGSVNPDPTGAIGKTTAQMKTLSTFTDPAVNWDFSDTDGDAADWMMLRENEDYPRLAWQTIYLGDIAGLYGVDIADLMELANNWLEQGCPTNCEQADIDGSGRVDLDDFAIMASLEEYQAVPTVPVAYWAMDETSGTVVGDSVGGHHGQTVNMAGTPWVAGKVGNCLSFDGVNDYVVMTGYKGITGTQSRTCTAWIKTDKVSSQIMSWGTTLTGQKWIVRTNENGTLRAEVQDGYLYGTKALTDNQWHHIAVVLADDGSPNISEASLYVDGQLETAGGVLACAVNTAAVQDVQLGAFTVSPLYYKGLLDEVRIYDVVLTGAEVLKLY